jgi:hypothetical protein
MMFLCSGLAAAQAANQASGDLGGVGENTRLMGTVFDVAGNPLSDVLIWVVNDNAPAAQARGRTRKTGNYLVRDMTSLYTERDTQGIVARARYEREGHRTVTARVAIPKNGVERLNPILARDDESLDFDGYCVVLVGAVTNAKGKGVKGAVAEVRENGATIAKAEPTKGNGEFELVLWNAAETVDLVVTGAGGESKTVSLTLEDAPQPDLVMTRQVTVSLD